MAEIKVQPTATKETPKDAPKDAPPVTAKSKKVKVVTKFPLVIDLITDTKITAIPVEIELHPWLQAQIDSNIIQVV